MARTTEKGFSYPKHSIWIVPNNGDKNAMIFMKFYRSHIDAVFHQSRHMWNMTTRTLGVWEQNLSNFTENHSSQSVRVVQIKKQTFCTCHSMVTRITFAECVYFIVSNYCIFPVTLFSAVDKAFTNEKKRGRQRREKMQCFKLNPFQWNEGVDIFSEHFDQFPLVNFSPYFFVSAFFLPFSW